ncbi:phosphomannomutase/phosphoglucomutase [Patescibacteria group bacterium]|nr:phosphomannomutase/phosphoglucomutase [Patescibacteria group bacterium]MBU4162403.1 phosphomannomutase/phosphoglucomutase [Patescibacteria group bacterium]
MNTSIFKAYDIRGLWPDQINKSDVLKISKAFAIFVKDFYSIESPSIIVGYDIRKSSEEIFDAVVNGLNSENCKVISIGCCSTPLNYFANWKREADGSVMITASHNPKEYNGLKFSLRQVVALAEENGVEKIKKIALGMPENDYVFEGKVKKQEEETMIDEYLDFLVKEAEGIDIQQFKIAVDCSNGMVGPEFKRLAGKLGIRYQGIFMEPDGDFPNHEPNPLNEKAIASLQELMLGDRFDFGIIFDGDGDRFMVLTEKGEMIRSDFLAGVLAKFFISKINNKKIVCDARFGRGMREYLEHSGIDIIKSKVGYSNIKKNMREASAFFGAELSAHFFWKDFCYAESPLLTLIRLMKILSVENKKINDMIKPMQNYFSSGELNFEVLDKEGKLKKIKQVYIGENQSHLDGLTVECADWWFNARLSNTESLLRLIVEAKSQKLLDEKVSELEKIIKEK